MREGHVFSLVDFGGRLGEEYNKENQLVVLFLLLVFSK